LGLGAVEKHPPDSCQNYPAFLAHLHALNDINAPRPNPEKVGQADKKPVFLRVQKELFHAREESFFQRICFRVRGDSVNQRGNFSLFILLAVISVSLIAMVFFSTMLATLSTKMYESMDGIIQDGRDSANGISDANVRSALIDDFDAAGAATAQNVDILTTFYKYSWVFILGIIALVFFLRARLMVETGGVGA
jgi:hypothetical protein